MFQSKPLYHEQANIRPVVYGIGLYFLTAGVDSLNIGSFGSVLKIIALIPVALLLLDLRQLRIHFSVTLIIQLFFWMLAVFSVFHSVDTSRSFRAMLTLTLNLSLVCLLGLTASYTEQELKFLQQAMLLGGWVSIGLMLLFSDTSADGRLTLLLGSETQDQNYINGYYIYTFSHHCSNMLLGRKRHHILPTVALLGIVLLTGSRGALVAYTVVIFVHICILFANSRHRIRNLMLVAGVIIMFFLVFDYALSQMPEKVALRFSWDYIAGKGAVSRTRIWRFFLRMFSAASLPRMLFGHGYGTASLLNTLNGYVAHNLYIDNLITLGVVGLLLQLATQLSIVFTLWNRKQFVLLGAYTGMLTMCLTLSLVSYKPLWNVMIMTLAIDLHCRSGGAPTTRKELREYEE